MDASGYYKFLVDDDGEMNYSHAYGFSVEFEMAHDEPTGRTRIHISDLDVDLEGGESPRELTRTFDTPDELMRVIGSSQNPLLN